ncbi:hypothetical protein LNQ52_30580 [Klebsiella pneumoniae subsp. pneumoniae]|nr:hypothetical protein [Klebsiella pneumoniae subsp. pneumoniae]
MNTVGIPVRAQQPGGFALWAARLQMAHGRKLVIALRYLPADPPVYFILPLPDHSSRYQSSPRWRAGDPPTKLIRGVERTDNLAARHLTLPTSSTDCRLTRSALFGSLSPSALRDWRGVSRRSRCLLLGYPLA